MVERGVNSPLTSSLGRLFDAAGALLGLVQTVGYEGEGPMKLEGRALAAYKGAIHEEGVSSSSGLGKFILMDKVKTAAEDRADDGAGDGTVGESGYETEFVLDAVPLLQYIAERRNEDPVEELSFLFHEAVADAAVRGAEYMRKTTGIRDIALSGGVFQNALLLSLITPRLERSGFSVYTNSVVPPGDGGISLGQIYFLG
jgi:hydrogenase maturation protein HypF